MHRATLLGVLQPMESQRAGYNLATQQQQCCRGLIQKSGQDVLRCGCRDYGEAGGGCLTPETLESQCPLRKGTNRLCEERHHCVGNRLGTWAFAFLSAHVMRKTAIKQLDGVIVAVWLSRVRLCDPMDRSPTGSSVRGILQARILEWVAMPFARGSSWTWDWTWVSHIAGRFFTVWATSL